MQISGTETRTEEKHLKKFDPLVDLGLDARQSSIVELMKITKAQKARNCKTTEKVFSCDFV